MTTPGHIVQTKSGKIGRTFRSKGMINGKVLVYIATETKELNCDGKIVFHPVAYSENATLCDPLGLKIIGFID